MASTVTVNSGAALTAALKTATAGETIRLAAGSYANVVIAGVNSGAPVTIRSASSTSPATLQGLKISASSNLTFRDVDLSAVGSSDAYFAFRVTNCSGIAFVGDKVGGNDTIAPGSQLSGFDISGSSKITIRKSSFAYLNAAITANNDSNLTIANNTFSEMSKGGVEMGASSNIRINGNSFTNFQVADGVHSDGIQLYTAGTTAAQKNINISENTIYRGAGDAMQGIFVQDETGHLPYSDLTIENNNVIGGYWNSIYVHAAVTGNLGVQGNMVESYAGTDKAAMTATSGTVTTSFLAGIDVIGNVSNARVSEVGNIAQTYIGANGAAEAAPTGNGSIGIVAALTQAPDLASPVVAQAQMAAVAEHGSAQGTLLAGDSGRNLYVSAFGTSVSAQTAVGTNDATYKGMYGQLTVQTNGGFVYTETKDGLVAGQAYTDTFSATVASASGGAQSESFSVQVTGSSTGNGGYNTIYCGAGPETVSNFGAGSRVYSGTGGDTYQFSSIAESTPSEQTIINGFKSGDIIDLSAVDPAFHFVSKFDGKPDELVVSEIAAGNWEVYGGTTGCTTPNFQIHLTNVVGSLQLAAADFDLSNATKASAQSTSAAKSLSSATNLLEASAAFGGANASGLAASLDQIAGGTQLSGHLLLAATQGAPGGSSAFFHAKEQA